MSDFWGADEPFFEHEHAKRRPVDYNASQRRQRELSSQTVEANEKSAILRQLTVGSQEEIAAMLDGLRKKRAKDEPDKPLVRGQVYLVTRDFVPPSGGVKRGTVIEVAGLLGDFTPFVRALERENDFGKNSRREFTILFVPGRGTL